MPLRNVSTLLLIDTVQMKLGYAAGMKDTEEPSASHTYSFWHGWKCGKIEAGHMPPDEHYKALQASSRKFLADMKNARW
jgi:hypothetical protein